MRVEECWRFYELRCLELISTNEIENFLLFVQFTVTDASESSSKRLGDVIEEIVVAKSSIPQTSAEDDKIGEKVRSPECSGIDVDRTK